MNETEMSDVEVASEIDYGTVADDLDLPQRIEHLCRLEKALAQAMDANSPDADLSPMAAELREAFVGRIEGWRAELAAYRNFEKDLEAVMATNWDRETIIAWCRRALDKIKPGGPKEIIS